MKGRLGRSLVRRGQRRERSRRRYLQAERGSRQSRPYLWVKGLVGWFYCCDDMNQLKASYVAGGRRSNKRRKTHRMIKIWTCDFIGVPP